MTSPVVVVPVKDLAGAKQRLAGVLSSAERHALFRAMLEDVLDALARTPGLDDRRVVTRDREACALAARYGARVVDEAENRGHTLAVSDAVRHLAAEGAAAMLTVPGDIPLATPDEFASVIAAHGPRPAVTIAPARDRLGSNAVLLTPPDVMALRFGDDSFQPHVERARSLGIEPSVVACDGIGLDVDTPEDLSMLLARPVASRAQRWLEDSGVGERVTRSGTA